MPGAHIPLSPAEVSSILADYSAGMTTQAIATKYGRGASTVQAQVAKAGLTRHKVDLAKDHPHLIERCAKLLRAGQTLKEATRLINTEAGTSYHYSTFRGAVRRMGMEVATSLSASPAQEPKTEVVYHDLVITKTTRMVPAGKTFSLDGVSMVPVSLSAGVRVSA